MFEFQDGLQYSLSTKGGSNKSVLFVKLTDSALHSIESFLHAKDEVTKPTIQFEGNNGTITVPQNGQKIIYGFTLSNLKADGSSFQCLQHSNKKSLKSLASMHMKMQVHANEDSYANTKCKMEAVEKEQKSLCTKEIKPNGKCIRKVSVFKHPAGLFPIKAVPFVKAQEHSGFLKPKEISNKPVSNKPMLSKEPIRKRIMHILAIKPFKKPDILLKLMKDGIDDEDKSSISEILNQVAVCKGKVYTLSNHLWNEVEDNWKFYSKEELEIIHRKKQNYLELNGFSASKKQNKVQKVNVNKSASLVEPKSKKQRTSYNNLKVSVKDVKSSTEFNTVITIKTNGVLNDLLPKQVNGHSKNVGLSNGESPKFDFDAFLKLSGVEEAELKGSSSCDDSSYENRKTSAFVSRLHYFTPKYVKITSGEQRAEYARHFNSMYTDYLKLHKKLKAVANKVRFLESELKECEEGSEDYELNRRGIMKIYKETALNYQYKTDWERFHILQKSLEEIKKLVTEYDNESS